VWELREAVSRKTVSKLENLESARNFCVTTGREPRLYASNNLMYPWDCIWLSLIVPVPSPSPCESEFCKS